MDSSAGSRKEESKSPPLSAELASLYGAITARAKYIAQDRPDVQYAVKELCRRMSDPTEADFGNLRDLDAFSGASLGLFPDSRGRRAQEPRTFSQMRTGRDAEPPERAHREGRFS